MIWLAALKGDGFQYSLDEISWRAIQTTCGFPTKETALPSFRTQQRNKDQPAAFRVV